jgi:hypothetical protein
LRFGSGALEAAVFSGDIYDEKGHNARVRLVNLDMRPVSLSVSKIGTFSEFLVGVAEFNQMTKSIRQRVAMSDQTAPVRRTLREK